MKTIWLSSLLSSEEKVKNLIAQLRTYGLEVRGHIWEDDLGKMAWSKPREELIKPEVSLWLILTSEAQLNAPSLRYGLSLLAMTVQAWRGASFPLVVLLDQGTPPSSENMPTALRAADYFLLKDPGMPAKVVARVHTPTGEVTPEYRLDVYGMPQIGQWFEIGPAGNIWPGAMFGVSEGEINFHAVGPKGSLPEQSVLEYPLKGLKLSMGEREYVAWAVQNPIDSTRSYFVRVNGCPESILFGPYSTQEEAEVYVVRL
jgi:hypothetical protein